MNRIPLYAALAVFLATGCMALMARATSAAVFPGPDAFGYVALEAPAVLRDVSGSGTAVPLGDDSVSGELPIGFPFTFYGIEYTTFRISSNGFVTLGGGGTSSGCCSGRPLPSPGSPDNVIAGWWEDLNNPAGQIRYQTLGTPGARELVVGFYDVPHFFAGPPVTFEIVLHEGSDAIEVQCWDCPSDGGLHSSGIENADGTIGLELTRTRTGLSRQAWLVSLTQPPDCSAAVAEPAMGWPPSHLFAEVSVAGVTDPDGDPVSIEVTGIRQDERPGDSDGPPGADGWGIGSDRARVRVERSGPVDGRVYHVEFVATDPLGGFCASSVQFCVPHDPPSTCVDQGPAYDSTRPVSLVESNPPPGTVDVSPGAWFELVLDAPPPLPAQVALECDGRWLGSLVSHLPPSTIVVNPDGQLPPDAECSLAWIGAGGLERIFFATASPVPAETIVYDRRDRNAPLPFPDDFFLVPAPTPTGHRAEVVVPDRPGVSGFLQAMALNAASADGFSPIGSLSVQLSAPADPATLPLTQEASLDPLAAIGLFDVTPGSATYGQRVPFKLTIRSDSLHGEPTSHNLVIFPATPLAPQGRYALVVTNQLRSASGAPFGRSGFFDEVVDGGEPRDEVVAKLQPLAFDVLDAAEELEPLAIPRDDVALAVRVSVRSTQSFPDDVVAMRREVLSRGASFEIDDVQPGFGSIAALVTGRFEAPDWLDGPFLARDAEGRPVPRGTNELPFILALPLAANDGYAPVTMYQHGSPGSAEAEVPFFASEFLAPSGFAVGGFTEILNRQFGADSTFAIFAVVLATGDVPDFWVQTYAEQIAFVKSLQAMSGLDVLPLGAPDGVPDLDVGAITYEGISWGSFLGQGFLAYAPEIRAAGLVAGAARLGELVEYQDRTTPTGDPPLLRETLPSFLPGATPPDVWMGLALFQMLFDVQDPHNHAPFIYRDPVDLGHGGRRSSILVLEGLGDSFTVNNSTRSLAWTLGPVPLVRPPLVPVSYLPTASTPIQGNVDAHTTAALVQFAPDGLQSRGIEPTPGCIGEFEGHFCPQTAPEATALRAEFYRTATLGTPVVADDPPAAAASTACGAPGPELVGLLGLLIGVRVSRLRARGRLGSGRSSTGRRHGLQGRG